MSISVALHSSKTRILKVVDDLNDGMNSASKTLSPSFNKIGNGNKMVTFGAVWMMQ